MNAAQLDRVSKRFGAITALDSATFAVPEGGIVALLGPNGAGKTTALAVLVGLRHPDSGSASLFGLDPRLAASRKEIGMTPQETAFPATLRVRELIDLVARHFDRPLSLAEVAERFQVEELLGRQAGGLSGGERRRVAVALAFVGGPRLVILDEPTTGLDQGARLAVWNAIREHAATGGTVLLTTHQLVEAETLARRVVLLAGGVVQAEESVEQIKAAAGLTRVRFRAPGGLRVDGAEPDGDRYLRLLTADAGAAVQRLTRAGVKLDDLEVMPLSLEEALAARTATP